MPDNRIDFPGAKYANPFLVPEYNQPMDGKRILPDPNRPHLLGTNATEYKIGVGIDGKEIQIPRVVGGQLLSNRGAFERYRMTGESFGTMKNPEAYSRFYDQLERLGIMMKPRQVMKRQQGGILYNPKDREKIIAERTRRDTENAQNWNEAEYRTKYPVRSAVTGVLDEVALTPQAMYDWKLLYDKGYNRRERMNNSVGKILTSGATAAAFDAAGSMAGETVSALAKGARPGEVLTEIPRMHAVPPRTGVPIEYGGRNPYMLNVGNRTAITEVPRNLPINSPTHSVTNSGMKLIGQGVGGTAVYKSVTEMLQQLVDKHNK